LIKLEELTPGPPRYRRRLQLSKERTSGTETIILFSFFEGSFLPTWILIQPTKINADPYPQHWISRSAYCGGENFFKYSLPVIPDLHHFSGSASRACLLGAESSIESKDKLYFLN
jgi:hypothetical protein